MWTVVYFITAHTLTACLQYFAQVSQETLFCLYLLSCKFYQKHYDNNSKTLLLSSILNEFFDYHGPYSGWLTNCLVK